MEISVLLSAIRQWCPEEAEAVAPLNGEGWQLHDSVASVSAVRTVYLRRSTRLSQDSPLREQVDQILRALGEVVDQEFRMVRVSAEGRGNFIVLVNLDGTPLYAFPIPMR